MIDVFIQYTQLNANDSTDCLEWTDFNQFDLVENTNKRDAFSSIYSAIWMECPSWNPDEEVEVWTRNGPFKVILKRLDNSQNILQEFINQICNKNAKRLKVLLLIELNSKLKLTWTKNLFNQKKLYKYYKCLQSGSLSDYFDMTKDLISCYMYVMKYYENVNLYSYLGETMGVLCWRDIVDMLWAISAGFNFIHERDLIQGYLHGENILVENEMDSIDTKIADRGLHGPVDKQISSKQIYGVITFIAPKIIFNGYTLTKESGIYSFSISTGRVHSYYDRSHDTRLMQEVCSGTRSNQCEPFNKPTSARRLFGKLSHVDM
ncbi:hypothetical protein RclHR1_01300020 [Rhizophagus clarus]|nr:hypothetical protein RclHR1_01300020 [Rhizophagus clarus]